MIWLILVAAIGPVQDPDLEELVERLGAESLGEREDAVAMLVDAGAPAVPLLEKAARGDDAEVRARAGVALEAIRLGAGFTPALRRAMPGLALRLMRRGDHEWTVALLETLDRRRHPDLGGPDRDPLALRALRHAEASELREVCHAIGRWKLKSAVPALLDILRSLRNGTCDLAGDALKRLGGKDAVPELRRWLADRDPMLRQKASDVLGWLDAREAVPEIAALLADDSVQTLIPLMALRRIGDPGALAAIAPLVSHADGGVRREAVETLVELGDDRRRTEVAALLEDPDPHIRRTAVAALCRARHAPSLPALLRRFEDPDADVRAEAARGTAVFRTEAVVRALTAGLRDDNPSVSFASARSLGECEAVSAIPEVRPLLKDPSSDARAVACLALALLDDQESASAIAALLRDKHNSVRFHAAEAIAILRPTADAPKVVEVLRAALKDDTAYVAEAAAHALGAMRVPEVSHAVAELLRETGGRERLHVSRALTRLGSADAVEVLLREGHRFTLNALRCPEGWSRLTGRVPRPREPMTHRALLETIATGAGMELILPKVFTDPQEDWLAEAAWFSPRVGGEPALHHLEGMCAHSREFVTPPFEIVIEPRAIRVIPCDEAKQFWDEWRKETGK